MEVGKRQDAPSGDQAGWVAIPQTWHPGTQSLLPQTPPPAPLPAWPQSLAVSPGQALRGLLAPRAGPALDGTAQDGGGVPDGKAAGGC